ncbi:MAG: response regulator [Bacteroidota bacterium]
MTTLPNLLIVDDIPSNLLLIESIVRKFKVNLIQALSGVEALQKIEGKDLALAIIDISMPVMDGFELALKINTETRKDKVPIIFITARNNDELDIVKGYNRGAVDYLIKPVSKHILESKIAIFIDIYSQKAIQTKQIHADRMANLGEMAAGIAHEINQPLNIISLVMDKILLETEKKENINFEYIKSKSERIFENISRIRNLIDHVRTFSRQHADYVLTNFDINNSITNAISLTQEQFKYCGIQLMLDLGGDIPQIIGNTYQFEQVIVNLLINSKDAVLEKKLSQEEYREMIVGIKSFREEDQIVVEVSDNGIGILREDFDKILLPFYTTKEEGKGTGLGLSICYQIIKEMGGVIEISSDFHQGTKIRLVLDLFNTEKNA